MLYMGTVLSVAEALLSTLQSSEVEGMTSIYGGKFQLKDLQGPLKTIIDALRVAVAQEMLSYQAQDWIQHLKDAVFEADDLVDDVLSVAKQNPELRLSDTASKLSSRPENHILSVAYRVSAGIVLIKGKLDFLAVEAKNRQSVFNASKIAQEPTWKSRLETRSYVNEEVEIIGREDDLERIVDTLLDSNNNNNNNNNDQRNLSVLSIVGTRGVGKTALAQLVYDHPSVKHAFPLRLWSCVSRQCQGELKVKDILSKILTSYTRDNPDQGSSVDRLRKQLAGKKYLLVLDDVWTVNRDHWCELVNYLTGGTTGSWILVTTRSPKTATIAGGLMHELLGLSEENSWCLFHRTAFASHEAGLLSELVEVGKSIAKGCAGVPLAIRVAGSLLYGQDLNKWQFVQTFGLASVHKSIMPILKLSFHHLESSLKSCLCYCLLFPKANSIEKEMLISLWMSQGYIVPLREDQSLEDAAQEYFTILLHRCFLHDVQKNAYGEIISCKLHDLIHQLACDVAGTEICIIDDQIYSNNNNKSRHLSLMGTTDANHFIHSTQIRSLLHFGGWYKGIKMDQFKLEDLLDNCKCLRTLDLSNLGIISLPNSIGQLLHLRYLNLSRNRDLEVLPNEITILFNLQTLILNGCHGLTKLPEDLSKLSKLGVLDIKECSSLTCMPCGLGKLTSLHILTEFVLSETSLNLDQWFDQLEEFKALQKLRGYLAIRIQSPANDIHANEVARRGGAYLSNKVYLSHIRISFTDQEVDGRGRHEELMAVLQPHPDIKGLDLCGYNSVRIAGWITFLPNLVRLCLENCRKLQYLPYSRNLIHLKVFHLVNLLNMEYIFESSTASASGSNPAISAPTGSQSEEVATPFPCLQQLHLINMPNLKGWCRSDMGLGVEDERMQSLFDRDLESLIVEGCPKLESVSPASRVEELSADRGARTSLTKESINPATNEAHDSKVIEEHEMDSNLPDLSLSLDVHPPQMLALPPPPLSVDLQSPQPASLFDDKVHSSLPDLPFNLNVHPPRKPDLPLGISVDDVVYTSPLSDDLQSPSKPDSPVDIVVDDALLFCSLFPPEYEFEKDALLQLWLANGIFEEEPMEEIAGLFFKYCLDKGYFEVSETNFRTSEEMYTFKGDICLVSKGSHIVRIEDTFSSDDLSPEVSHVSVCCRSLNDSSDRCQFERLKQLRTLIFLQGQFLSLRELPYDFFLSLEFLRALDLSHSHLELLPSSIGNMVCLRYFDLTNTPIKHLPEALGCLEKLQTLKLRGCSNLYALPKGVRKLRKLRHIDFDVLRQLRLMPEGMGALINIRTLSAFIVGVDEGRNIRQLMNMNNISGSFCISGLQNVLRNGEAVEAYLCHKSQLKKLELRWSDSKEKDVSGHEEVLSSLQPHASLEGLRIGCYGGSQLPSWICDPTFCRLVNITLVKCENCMVLPSIGLLPVLKSLNIVGFKKLKVIDHNFYGVVGSQEFIAFPKLESLTIQDMPSLREWENARFYCFPELLSLTVQQCPELLEICPLSFLGSLEILEITHCGNLEPHFVEKLSPSLKTFIIEECPLINAMIFKDKDKNCLERLSQISNSWIDHEEIQDLEAEEDPPAELLLKKIQDLEAGHAHLREEMSKLTNLASNVSDKVRSKMKTGDNIVLSEGGDGDSCHSDDSFYDAPYSDPKEDGNSSGASTPRGDSVGYPLGVFSQLPSAKSPVKSNRDSTDDTEAKTGIHKITSKAEAWIGKKGNDRDTSEPKSAQFSWLWVQAEHDPDRPHAAVKPEIHTADFNRTSAPNEATGSWLLFNVNSASSASSRGSGSSNIVNKLDVDTDCLDYEITWEDLTIGEQIGQGYWGTVYRGLWYGSDVAIKVFSKQEYSEDVIYSFRQEVSIMKRLWHPNVLLLMGVVISPQRLCIVTEFVPRGSLFRLLQSSTAKLDWRRRIHMALDIARGMNYLHCRSPPIIHHNLTTSNVLIDKNWMVKVADFGFSRVKHETYLTTKTGKGTPQWMAPEVLRNERSDEKSDLYSFGVILWELATQKIPWENLNAMQVVGAVGFLNQRLDMPEDVDSRWASIIESCWHSDPQSRPTFKELLVKLKDLQRQYAIQFQAAKAGSADVNVKKL